MPIKSANSIVGLQAKATLCYNPHTRHILCMRKKSGWSYGPPVSVTTPQNATIVVGKYARLANGSALAKEGDTSVLVTVVSDTSKQTQESFLPLTVDYRQRASATGRIPTNFLRREISQSNTEILASRKIDRSVRPLFPDAYKLETQISCNLVAFDRSHQPDILAINAASAALTVSNIPWEGPVGAVRVGWVNNEPVVNPDRQAMAKSKLDLIVTAKSNTDVVMLDGSALELPYSDFDRALKFGATHASRVSQAIESLKTRVKPDKVSLTEAEDNQALVQWLREKYGQFITAVFSNTTHDKFSRDNALEAIRRNAIASALEQEVSPGSTHGDVREYFDKLSKQTLRDLVLSRGMRPDGRSLSELRSISCDVDIHKPLHGSSIFQRGQTQVMASVTLDSLDSMARTDAVAEILVGRPEKNFMLHYEFPQYATGEIGKGSGVGRREVGHGALAEKGLRPVIPEDFPFTIRVSAEVLESAGSSSMATVCAGSLALLDAGVPITRPAAGVAMGLITKQGSDKAGGGEYALLTDIMGLEDYAGDIDYKTAGTTEGLTAVQADVKIPGVKLNILQELQKHALKPLHTILKIMSKKLRTHRVDRKDNWPVSEKLTVPMKQRSALIGVGGANIRRIQSVTGVQISSNKDDLTFDIFAPNAQSLEAAKAMFEEFLGAQGPEMEFEFGNVYTGKIVELQKPGALVLIHPNRPPVFVRNSQLDLKLVHHSEAAGIPVGETIHIKYFGADPVTGEERWSRRALLSPGGFSRRLLPKDDPSEQVLYRKPSAYTHPSKEGEGLHDPSTSSQISEGNTLPSIDSSQQVTEYKVSPVTEDRTRSDSIKSDNT